MKKGLADGSEESVREELLRSIVDNIAAPVTLCTPTGKIEAVNRFGLDYHGKTLEDMQRWEVNDLIHANDLPGARATWTRSIENGEPYNIELRLRRGDGTYRWTHSHGFPVKDADGRIVRWCILHTDIDDRKRVQDELRDTQAELAHMSRVMMMGQLTASIAHELNQPLAGIITNAGTCLRMLSANPPNVAGALETARRTIRDGNRASEVITRLRALFSKKRKIVEDIDLNAASQEVIALTSAELQRSSVVLRTEFSCDLPHVAGDRIQLQQVILNLIVNGIEAMSGVSDRPRELLVTTRRDGPDFVRVGVRDTGVGIDPLTVEKLFSPFFTTKSNGMGIGLSVCRSIVENHGGQFSAEANDGPGAAFFFSVPCKSAHRPDGMKPKNQICGAKENP